MRVWTVLCLCSLLIMTGHSQLLGGFKHHEGGENDEDVQKAAEFAVSELPGDGLKLQNVVSVHKQTVAGINYKLVLEVTDGSNSPQKYEALVYKGLGDAPHKLTEYKRLHESQVGAQKGGMLGGPKEVSVDDPEVKQAAEFAVTQLKQQSNSLSPMKLEEILAASTKVHRGTVYGLKLRISQGNMPEQVMQVDVARSVDDNSYSLSHVEKVSSSDQQ